MNKFLTISAYTTLLLGAFLITGCSSSDDGGGTTSTEITAENMEALATAGTEGAKQAVDSTNSPIPFAKTGNVSALQKVTISLAQTINHNPKFAISEFFICDSGSAILDIDENTGNGSFIFNLCRINISVDSFVEYNGGASFVTNISDNIITTSITYNNFTITTSINGTVDSESIDLSATCTTNTDTYESSCTYNSTALGIDGRTYSVSDISVSGDSLTGYTVSATVTDPNYGIITITTSTPVTFNNCPNGQPDAGAIVVSDGTNTMTVTYNDCDSFSIDFDGSTTTFFW